jgi:hypothetical protein
MPCRAVCYYDRQLCLFLHFLYDGKRIDRAVPIVPGHAGFCFQRNREHRLPSSIDHNTEPGTVCFIHASSRARMPVGWRKPDAEALIRDHGAEAYSKARQRRV